LVEKDEFITGCFFAKLQNCEITKRDLQVLKFLSFTNFNFAAFFPPIRGNLENLILQIR